MNPEILLYKLRIWFLNRLKAPISQQGNYMNELKYLNIDVMNRGPKDQFFKLWTLNFYFQVENFISEQSKSPISQLGSHMKPNDLKLLKVRKLMDWLIERRIWGLHMTILFHEFNFQLVLLIPYKTIATTILIRSLIFHIFTCCGKSTFKTTIKTKTTLSFKILFSFAKGTFFYK